MFSTKSSTKLTENFDAATDRVARTTMFRRSGDPTTIFDRDTMLEVPAVRNKGIGKGAKCGIEVPSVTCANVR